jgi:hypothetical protein
MTPNGVKSFLGFLWTSKMFQTEIHAFPNQPSDGCVALVGDFLQSRHLRRCQIDIHLHDFDLLIRVLFALRHGGILAR